MAGVGVDITVALRDFTLRTAFAAGPEVVALVGPSGAGKSTVLRSIAGLVQPDSGQIDCGGSTLFCRQAGRPARVDLAPELRNVGYVPQHQALFPHRTVRANVAYGSSGAVADELLGRFGIGHLAGERPGGLSGGERQRVALARALARRPAVLLLDEPLTGLDTQTRGAVRAELGAELRRLAIPVLLVTHDFSDAAALADRVVVIEHGRIHQQGTPHELLERPQDAFVTALAGGSVVEHDGAEVAVFPWEIEVVAAGSPQASLLGTVRELMPAGGRIRVRTESWTGECAATSAPALGSAVGGVVGNTRPLGETTISR